MLACPQDLFYDSNANSINKYPGLIHDQSLNEFQHKDKCTRQRKDDLDISGLVADDLLDSNAITANNLKDKEEQVWPPDVESAFIEALESIPKLGRRKILVNGKPCGRNELISDFIFRKTCKIRTRKQVSSHIQVLKNTRKNDTHFMRLLTDSVDSDDIRPTVSMGNALKQKMRPAPHHHPIHHQAKNGNAINMKKYQTNDSFSSDDSSINSSPSPTDYVFDIMYGDPAQQQALSMLQFKDIYDPFQQSLFSGMVNNAPTTFDANDPFFGSGMLLDQPNVEESFINSLTAVATMPSTPTATSMIKKRPSFALTKKAPKKRKSLQDEPVINFNSSLIHSEFSLWPNYICLYLEYVVPYDPCRPLSHNLSQLPQCTPHALPTVSVDAICKERCPTIATLAQNSAYTVLLLAKTKLDLNLNIADFSFNNTSFFETQTRRTIECTTTIYSFGNVVLESKEVQQALWVSEGKFMYSFVFVNQFFDAFMKGIRSLQSWDEVDIAINNLCIVQSFEDVEHKYTSESISPLLVMVYEFERGQQGTIDISAIVDNEDISKTLEFIEQEV